MALTGKQAIVGCVLSCAGIVLISLLVVVGFTVWLTRPGQLIEPELLFAQDTTGYVTWTLDLEDAGTAGFVRALNETIAETRRRQLEGLPGPLAGVLGALQSTSGGDLEKLFPLALVWTSSPDRELDGDLRLLSISLASAGNRLKLADWVLGFVFSNQDGTAVHEYDGERIYQVRGQDPGDDRVTFFLRGNDLFFVTDFTTAERVIARLNALAPSARPPTELDRLYALADQDAALRGAIVNARGELFRLWRTLAWESTEPLAWEEVSGLVLGGGLTAEGAFEGSIELYGREAGWARERSAPLVEAIAGWIASLPVEVDAASVIEDERVRIRIRAEDLARRLETWEQRQAD